MFVRGDRSTPVAAPQWKKCPMRAGKVILGESKVIEPDVTLPAVPARPDHQPSTENFQHK